MARAFQCMDTRRSTDDWENQTALPAAAQLSSLLASSQDQYSEISSQMKLFAAGPLKSTRGDLLVRQQEHEATLRQWTVSLQQHLDQLSCTLQMVVNERQSHFRWDQRFNPFSRRHQDAKAAFMNEQALANQCSNLQHSLNIELQNIDGLRAQLETRLLPPLLMRVGQEELLDGEVLGVVRAVIGNYGGFGFGLVSLQKRYRNEESQNFALAARELQRSASALGADAVVGVRWLQCDEFEIEEDRDDNSVKRRRVQRHKPFEAMLCGTAVRVIPSQVQPQAALALAGQVPYDGHLFCSTIREPPYGAVVAENLGIVQGIGINVTLNFTFNATQATQNLAMDEMIAFSEAHESLLASARQLGANAVLGVKPEEPFHRMCVLRGSAVRLAACPNAMRAQPLARIQEQLPPSSLQIPPANLKIIETIGLVSAVGMRPPQWFRFNDPSQTEEESFYNGVQALSQRASQMGANAVFGVKWMHDNDRFVSNVVGTAVVLGRLPVPTPHMELPFTLQPFASTLREPPQGFRVSAVIGLAVAAGLSPYYAGGNFQTLRSAQGEVEALHNAVQKLQAYAAQVGAHAILGVKIEALSVYNCSRFMAVVKGTAVRLAQHDAVGQWLPFHGDHVEISSMQAPAAHLCVAQIHGLVSSVGYRPWRFALGFRKQRRQDAENEQTTFAAAVQNLVDQARQLGANGVLAIKWQHDDDHRCSCLVGTAVTLSHKPGANPPASLGSGRAPFVTTSRTPPRGLAVAHTLGVVSGAGMSNQGFAFGAQSRANIDKEAYDAATACLNHNAASCNCDAVLGMKMESPEPGLVILRGTAVRLAVSN